MNKRLGDLAGEGEGGAGRCWAGEGPFLPADPLVRAPSQYCCPNSNSARLSLSLPIPGLCRMTRGSARSSPHLGMAVNFQSTQSPVGRMPDSTRPAGGKPCSRVRAAPAWEDPI